MSLSDDVPALEIHLVILLKDILAFKAHNDVLLMELCWVNFFKCPFSVCVFLPLTYCPLPLPSCLLQARDDILNGSHPVSFDKACEFAGIQAQIQFGPHVEHKHKPGFLE